MARNNRIELKLTQKHPKLLKMMFKLQMRFSKKLEDKDIEDIIKIFHKRSKNLPEPDREFFMDKENSLGIYR